MSRGVGPARVATATLALLASFSVLASSASAQNVNPPDDGSVTISGRAYEFNHMTTYIPGATVRVREIPGLSATTDASGDYELEVPDSSTVTPYIDPPDGYNQIDLQTFHTRGRDIVNANFQTPADLEYNALAALLGVPFGPDGRPTECVIVSTASARDVRGVDFPTFTARTPHGVAGATASEFPEIPGPTYFNASVIPDPTQPSTSEDGGMIWTAVPAGTYRIATSAPTTRFASFLATCKPGRVVNANPPWGAYELSKGEKPLAAGTVAAGVLRANSAGVRIVRLRIGAGERVSAKVSVQIDGRVWARKQVRKILPGKSLVEFKVPRSAPPLDHAKLDVRLEDAVGEKAKTKVRLGVAAL